MEGDGYRDKGQIMNIKQELEEIEKELRKIRQQAAHIKYDLDDIFMKIHRKIRDKLSDEYYEWT